jgi:hypothetical protein
MKNLSDARAAPSATMPADDLTRYVDCRDETSLLTA